MNVSNKVVIVGAGMAGLTAAAYLTKEKYDVLVLDMNDRTGGLVSTFSREGFSFDTGPRAFVNSGMVKPILRDLEIEFEEISNKISIAVEDEIFQIDSLESIDEYKKVLFKLYPENKDDIDKIMSYIYELSKYTEVLYEFDNPNFVDYISDKKVLFKEFLPWTFKLLKTLRKFNKFNLPMEEFLKDLTENQSLIDILTQYFFKKTPTYFALGYFQVYLDYFYPKNGTGTLPKLLEDKVLNQGGKIKLETKISEVIPSKKVVVDANGNSYEYDYLIWAADLKTLYKQMNPLDLDKKTLKKLNVQSNKVLSSKAAESVFIMFLAVDRPSAYFKEISGEHMFYTPSKNGLGVVNRVEKDKLIADFDNLSKKEVFNWLNSFCDLNTYEVSIPVLRDISLAPKEKTGIMISCLFDYEVVEKIEKAGWIREFKETIENRIIDLFSKSIFPDLDKDILFKLSTTPLAINSITGNSEGGIVGWSFESEPPVYNKLKDLPKSVATPFSDIYQASQWAYAPAGVPIAMLTGWHATQRIIKNKKSRSSK